MTNEWDEFRAYTEQPIYAAEGKKDTRYLGRFTYKTLMDFDGLGRILTILARGCLFHDRDGAQLPGSAYDRVEHARDALCAWCSVPDSKKSSDPPVDFRELSTGFPELVNAKGEGWLYRHVRAAVKFVKKNPELVDVRAQDSCAALSKGFTREWKKEDTDWVVLPVANFNCFYGNTNFSRKWLSRIPEHMMERSKEMMGVCRYRIKNAMEDGSKFGSGCSIAGNEEVFAAPVQDAVHHHPVGNI